MRPGSWIANKGREGERPAVDKKTNQYVRRGEQSLPDGATRSHRQKKRMPRQRANKCPAGKSSSFRTHTKQVHATLEKVNNACRWKRRPLRKISPAKKATKCPPPESSGFRTHTKQAHATLEKANNSCRWKRRPLPRRKVSPAKKATKCPQDKSDSVRCGTKQAYTPPLKSETNRLPCGNQLSPPYKASGTVRMGTEYPPKKPPASVPAQRQRLPST